MCACGGRAPKGRARQARQERENVRENATSAGETKPRARNPLNELVL